VDVTSRSRRCFCVLTWGSYFFSSFRSGEVLDSTSWVAREGGFVAEKHRVVIFLKE
jgi:hypothetical protein